MSSDLPSDQDDADLDALGAAPDRPKPWSNILRRDMIRNEQLAVYAGALFALGITVYFVLNPATATHGSKSTHESTALTLAIGGGVFFVMAAAARYGRRFIAAVVSLVAAFGMGQILGFVYIGLGAWLMFRSSRLQRQQRQSGGGGSRAQARPARERPARPLREPRSRRNRVEPETPAVKRAPASKRYTPPAARARKR